jgi:ribonuclease J
VQPEIAVPVHGEAEHLAANGQVAKHSQVPRQLIGRNGDLYQFAPQVCIRRQLVKTSRIALAR